MQPDVRLRAAHAAHFWTRLSLDRDGEQSLQRQLYEQIRDGIILGLLPSGVRIPASRVLAGEIACSRNTVLAVLNQLIAEDYLCGVRGSGVFVAAELPDEAFAVTHSAEPALLPDAREQSGFSTRGASLAGVQFGQRTARHVAFAPSIPDVSLFPMDIWSQLNAQVWRDQRADLLTQSDPRGYLPLREAIAEYVFEARNVACSPDQVFITTGVQQGWDIASRLLLDAGDCAWVEDPCYPVVRALLEICGAKVVPIPLDAEGLDFSQYADQPPRLIAVSPTHQFPTGVIMSPQRRIELLAYAARVGAWILEDDYDSEFRYFGRPLSALAGLGPEAAARVIHAGTFSKMMFPAIRVGYLVVPPALAREFTRGRAVIDLQPSIMPQPALARFLAEGHLAAHLRRMRPIYRQRQHVMIGAFTERAADLLLTDFDPVGMHVAAYFTPQLAAKLTDIEASERANERGITALPLSIHYATADRQQGFVLGYAAADAESLLAAAHSLIDVLRA